MAEETMKIKTIAIKMAPDDYNTWMDMRKSLGKKTHYELLRYLIDFFIGSLGKDTIKSNCDPIPPLRPIIELPSATMDHPSTVSAMDMLSNSITNVNRDIIKKRLEIIEKNVNIKSEETGNFEKNLSIQDKDSVNQIFASKEVIKVEDENEDGGIDNNIDEYDFLFDSDDDENIEEEKDDDYIPASPASYGDDEESDDEPPAKKHAMANENPEPSGDEIPDSIADENPNSEADENEQISDEKEESINHPLMVYKHCLVEIARYVPPDRCFECGNIVRLSDEMRGSKIILKWYCIYGHRNYEWHSQPKLRNNCNLGDLAICSATVLSRLNYLDAKIFFDSLKLPFISKTSFCKYKRTFVVPVINATWERDVKKGIVEGDLEKNESNGVELQKDSRENRNVGDSNEDKDELMDTDIEIEKSDKRLKSKKDQSKCLKNRRKESKNKSDCDDDAESETQNDKTNKVSKKKGYDNKEVQTSKNRRNGKTKRDSQIDRNTDNFGDRTDSQNDMNDVESENNEDSQVNGGKKKFQNDKDKETYREDSEEDGEEDGEDDGEELDEEEDVREERSIDIDDKKDYEKKLDDIDYYHNKDREQKVRKDGKKCWKHKRNKNTNHVSVYRLLKDKQYDYIPKIFDDIVMAFNSKNASINPKNQFS